MHEGAVLARANAGGRVLASPTGTAIMWYVDLLGIVRRAA
jgi:hypothetical protein